MARYNNSRLDLTAVFFVVVVLNDWFYPICNQVSRVVNIKQVAAVGNDASHKVFFGVNTGKQT